MIALSKAEIRLILAAIVLATPFGRRDYLLILFLYHTGLRVGECSGLEIDMVSRGGQPRQYLHLPARICKGSRGRVVPLNRVAQECISKMLQFNSARGLGTGPKDPVFQNKCHGRLSVRSIQKLVAGYRATAGLDIRATPHSLRHTHASELVSAGVPTVHVQKVLGHRKISSTEIYTHVRKEQLLQSARALE